MSPCDPISRTLVGKTVLCSEHLPVVCSLEHFCSHEATNSKLGYEAESGSSGRTGNCSAKRLAIEGQPIQSTDTLVVRARMKRFGQTGLDVKPHYCHQIQVFGRGWVLRPQTEALLPIITGRQLQLLARWNRVPQQIKFDERFVVLCSIFPAINPALHTSLRYLAYRA